MYRNLNKSRIKFLFIITVGLFVIFSARLIYFQWIKRDYYKGMAEKQYNYGEAISSLKYQVLSSDGKYLQSYYYDYVAVINIRLFKLNNYENNMDKLLTINYIMKENIEDFDINSLLNGNSGNRYYLINAESYEKLLPIVKKTKGIYVFKREAIDNITNSNIVNILTNIKNSDDELKEMDSLERKLNSYMENNEFLQAMVQVDKSGYIKQEGYKVPELPYVTLTINKELQDTIESVLRDELFSKFKQIGATIIEAETGKIRAMAQKDDYNVNINIAADQNGYPPGSTYKLMSAEYALENNLISTETEYYCAGIDSCKGKSHGRVNMEKAINLSCNSYFVDLGNEFTAEELKNFSMRQGYLDKVLNLDKETKGKVNSKYKYSLILGGSIDSSIIQVAASLSAIVNEGYYIKPMLIEDVTNNKGESVMTFPIKKEKVISKETADIIKGYMRTTVINGTGASANLEGVEIGGKTGTAEKPVESVDPITGETIKTNHEYGWFAGYFKKDSKYYTMVVMVPDINMIEDEGIEYQGSNTAGPVFREILKRIKEMEF
ncbi:penicillin-binding transpeptidase domain-containing protein [Alloiococcus sp. CFN-8]|uniref:penicillin-binding transpeptidase domain-containing protein n=1 Tax=Alloiococcus sp. CFN-8 TaxID=3416081 RepID=UPI003CF70E19